MEAISIRGWQQLCGFHSLQCASKRLPFCAVGASPSGKVTFGFPMGTQVLPMIQLQSRKSCMALSSLIGSAKFRNHNAKPRSCRLRSSWRGAGGFPPTKGLFLDVRGGTARRLQSLHIGCRRKERKFFLLATAGDGSSSNAGDSTSDEDERTRDATSSSRKSSFIPPWLAKLKQIDWNNLIFNWRKDEPVWSVPWTGQTIFQVMILWFAAFWVMGSWVLPIAAHLAGFSRHSLTFRGQALYSLITDIAEGAVGVWILRRCLAQFFPLPKGWFPLQLQGSWLLEACWGCLLFPFVNKLSQLNLYLIPLPPLATTYVEQSMMSRDPVATFLYAIVISVCAPLWEEVIFRGFLLPSMTRYVPLWGAIFVSALAFALAHFSMQRILPLTFLGLVMGFVFVRSKNLLASIVLHSLWNGFAFLELL